LFVQFFENLLYLFLMVGVRGADKIIIGSIHQIPDLLYLPSHFVLILLGGNLGFLRLQLDLLSMLVCPGLVIDVIALLTFVAGDGVRQHDLIGIADMRFAGGVGNRRSHIIFSFAFLTHTIVSLLNKIPIRIKNVFDMVSL